MPAKEAEAVSSAVAEERTATGGRPLSKARVRVHDGRADRLGHGLGLHHRSDLLRRRLQGGRVVDVEVAEPGGDALAEAGVVHEARVGGRADHEAVRHGHAGGGQLAEIRPLAPGVGNVGP